MLLTEMPVTMKSESKRDPLITIVGRAQMRASWWYPSGNWGLRWKNDPRTSAGIEGRIGG